MVSDHEGRYELLLNDVEDAAGNVLTGTVLGAFTIDGSPPTIDAVTLNAERFSAQPNFNAVEVSLSVSESLTLMPRTTTIVAQEVLLLLDTSPRPFTCDPFVPNASDDEAAPHVPGTYLCETVLDGTEGDGLQFIQI